MKKLLLIPLLVILSLSKDLCAQTLPVIPHTNDPHVLSNRREQIKDFLLPPRSASPSIPAEVPTNLRDGAMMYDQTQRVYVRYDSVAHAFVRAEADNSFLDPFVFSGNGLSITTPFTLRDTIFKTGTQFLKSSSTTRAALIVEGLNTLSSNSTIQEWHYGGTHLEVASVGYTGIFFGRGMNYVDGGAYSGLALTTDGAHLYRYNPNGYFLLVGDSLQNYYKFDRAGFYYYNPTDTSTLTKQLVVNPSTGKVYTQTITGGGGTTTYPLTNSWGINSFSFDGGTAGIQVGADTSSGKLATQYYASVVVGADGIISGLVTTTSGTTATTTSGVYRLNNALVTKGSSTNTTIPSQDATLNRYTLIVADASGTFSAVNGTLAADAVEPDIPANKALMASIYIPATGGTVTTGGSGGKGTVTKVSSTTTDILVANATTTPALTLNKVNGVSITYYDPTSSIQTQLNGKQATGNYLTALTGDISASGPGSASATVNQINGVTKNYYDPTSSIQTQLNNKQASLGFTPENVANKTTTTTLGTSNTLYPTQNAVKTYVDNAISGVTVPTAANPTANLGLTPISGSASTFMRSDAAPALSQSIVPIWTGLHTWQQNGIGTTFTDGIYLQNNTASTSGAPNQYSPNLHFGARVFTGGVDNWVDWITLVQTQISPSLLTKMIWRKSRTTTSAPSYSDVMSLDDSGSLTVTGAISASLNIGTAAAVSAGTFMQTPFLNAPNNNQTLNIGNARTFNSANTGFQFQLGAITHSSGTWIQSSFEKTYNETGSASDIDLRIVRTETALSSTGTHKFLSLLAGSAGTTELFAIDNKGKISVPTSGGAQTAGTATLSSGTVTVSTTAVTANSIIILSYKTPSGTLGNLQQGTITPGTSFVINSLTSAGATNTADNSTVNYWIIN